MVTRVPRAASPSVPLLPNQREAYSNSRNRGWGPPEPSQAEDHLEPSTPPGGESQEAGTERMGLTGRHRKQPYQWDKVGSLISHFTLPSGIPEPPTPHQSTWEHTPEFARPTPPLLGSSRCRSPEQRQGLRGEGLPKPGLSSFFRVRDTIGIWSPASSLCR